ncbi:MAG: GC-type dockerin domain-anchored protein [Planctomycetota bacterium]
MRTTSNRVSKQQTAAALIAASGAFFGGAHANITKTYNSPTNSVWHITGMIDLDQRRAERAANFPLQGLSAENGLLNGGRMFCVPTATMNMLAYAASHGYPEIDPGVKSYAEWAEPLPFAPHYDDATYNLRGLGWLMGTGGDDGLGGTSVEGWYDGTRAWVPEDLMDVSMALASVSWAPRAQHIGQLANAGALTSICYGRYPYSVLFQNGGSLTDRDGGHCVTTKRIEVLNNTNAEYWYRNPSTSDSEWFQDEFKDSVTTMTDGVYSRPGYANRTLSRLSLTVSDGEVRLLDSIFCLWPKEGLTSGPSGKDLSKGTKRGFYSPDHPNFDKTVTLWSAQSDDELIWFEQSPFRDETALVVRTIEPATGSPIDVLLIINNVTGESFDTGIQGTTASIGAAWGPEGRLYGVTGNERFVLEKQSGDFDGDGMIDEGGYSMASASLGVFDAFGNTVAPSDCLFDDSSLTFRVLFPTIGHVKCYRIGGADSTGTLAPEESTRTYGTVWTQNTQFAMDAMTGATLFADNGPGEIEGWVPCPNDELNDCYVPNTFAPPSGGTGDIVPDGNGGFYLVGLDNVVRAFDFDQTTLLARDPDAPFEGTSARAFQITRSRTNYDPALHADWDNIPVEELVESDTIIRECSGDVTTTGATLDGQPGFGVPDGTTDLDDLGYFLNRWIAGADDADVTTTGATLEGQGGFGLADGSIDLDDLGYYLNAWITGCP